MTTMTISKMGGGFNKYTISLLKPDIIFLQSIATLGLPGAFLVSPSLLEFYGSSLNEIKSPCTYSQAVRLAQCITIQQKLLEEYDSTFYTLETADVVSLNEGAFFFCSNVKRKMMSSAGRITFRCPFTKSPLSSPELVACTELPCTVCVEQVYYTIAMLIADVMDLSVKIRDLEFASNQLLNIKETKLYWFMWRCFCPELEPGYVGSRSLLYL